MWVRGYWACLRRPVSKYYAPLRDTELVQKLLGLPAPWRVTAGAAQETVRSDSPLGQITIRVSLLADVPYNGPECEAAVVGYDTRRGRFPHTLPGKRGKPQ